MAAEFESELKRWGNSYAVRVPKDLVEAEGLREGDPLLLRVAALRKPDPRAFGARRGWRLDPQKMKDELRRAHAR